MSHLAPTRKAARLQLSLGDEPTLWSWLTRIAYAAVLVIVIARFMTSDLLRDPWDIAPGSAPVPRAAGPGTSAVLDLLCGLPVLLVLIRAAFDHSFPLRRRWSDAPMLALGLWAVASVGWASDRFLAAVSAADLLAAIALLWTASQTVRSWLRLRLTAAVGFGLLGVLVAQSVLYRTIDVQENVRYWHDHRQQILAERGWREGSFVARQFEQKLNGGDLSGFFNSPNTFAAVGVMLLFVSLGIPLQKRADREPAAWWSVALVAGVFATWTIVEGRSKTAAVTPVLGIALLLAVRWRRQQIRSRPLAAYWIGVSGTTLLLLASVGHGWFHHGLFPGHFSNSLDFRWKYWVASVRIFAAHPVVGVGWANFGRSYLAARLPEASEEIKDPHNFLVRCFAELGLIGGALLFAWLLRAGWELVRGATDERPSAVSSSSYGTVGGAAAVAVAGVALNVAATIDFAQPGADIVLELMRRLLYVLVLLVAVLGGSMRSPQRPELDDRPAPWMWNSVLVAVLLLLVHNLIDFSLFETGVLCWTLMLVGAAMGVRPTANVWGRPAAGIAAAVLSIAWVLAAAGFAAPVVLAEQHAADADELIRTLPTDNPASEQTHWSTAAADLLAAHALVPYNSDYLYRAARASLAAGDAAAARDLLTTTQKMDPLWIDPYLLKVNMELRRLQPDRAEVTSDFDQVVRLNPNDVSLRQQQAAALERLGEWHAAGDALRAALRANDALPAGEPKRLSPPERLTLQTRADQDDHHD